QKTRQTRQTKQTVFLLCQRTFSASCSLSALIRDSQSEGKSRNFLSALGEERVSVVFCRARMSQPVHHTTLSTDDTYPKDKTNAMATPDFLSPTDTFIHRHLGPTDAEAREMLTTLGLHSLEEL